MQGSAEHTHGAAGPDESKSPPGLSLQDEVDQFFFQLRDGMSAIAAGGPPAGFDVSGVQAQRLAAGFASLSSKETAANILSALERFRALAGSYSRALKAGNKAESQHLHQTLKAQAQEIARVLNKANASVWPLVETEKDLTSFVDLTGTSLAEKLTATTGSTNPAPGPAQGAAPPELPTVAGVGPSVFDQEFNPFWTMGPLPVTQGVPTDPTWGQLQGEPATYTTAPILKKRMHDLWRQHVAFTRTVIVDISNKDASDFHVQLSQLLANAVDIGRTFSAFYGPEVGFYMAFLLQQHVTALVSYVFAAYTKDDAGKKAALAALTENARVVSINMEKLNPQYWPRAAIYDILSMHLQHTKTEIDDRVAGDAEGEERALVATFANARVIGDAIADGIIRQYGLINEGILGHGRGY